MQWRHRCIIQEDGSINWSRGGIGFFNITQRNRKPYLSRFDGTAHPLPDAAVMAEVDQWDIKNNWAEDHAELTNGEVHVNLKDYMDSLDSLKAPGRTLSSGLLQFGNSRPSQSYPFSPSSTTPGTSLPSSSSSSCPGSSPELPSTGFTTPIRIVSGPRVVNQSPGSRAFMEETARPSKMPRLMF